MEKFYMQDSQQEKGRKGKKGLRANVDFSVALSVIVAAFALFSIASFGLINNQKDTVSYAAPTDGFTMFMRDQSDENGYSGVRGYHDGSTDSFYVPFYYANSESESNLIFCIQKSIAAATGIDYRQEGTIDDPGLIYILKHSYASGEDVVGGSAPPYVEIWATQAAIWLYASENLDQDNNAIPATGMDSIAELKAADTFKLIGGGLDSPAAVQIDGVYEKVQALVNRAEAASSEPEANIKVNAKTEELSKTSDGKYYQSTVITITGDPANSLTKFDITSITGIDGVKVVDENGRDLARTDIPAGKKFYLRIPVSKVTEKDQIIKVSIKGYFTDKTAVHFVATTGNYQSVVSLEDNVQPKVTGFEYEIVGSPDTGMNTAQTIYFIGLIVLLCGVGIVYANTKPVESKQ